MFTGIIQHVARIQDVSRTQAGVRLILDAEGWTHAPEPGESIAVSGCCLTVVESQQSLLHFDVIAQTLRNTTLGELRPGDRVNLEHAATPSTLLGGHIVQGHIDGTGIVAEVLHGGGEHRLRLVPDAPTQPHYADMMDWIIDRGSIALDGVSLTVACRADEHFDVALIPTTLELTTLSELKTGDRVNLEADYLAKTVIQWVQRQHGPGGAERLRRPNGR